MTAETASKLETILSYVIPITISFIIGVAVGATATIKTFPQPVVDTYGIDPVGIVLWVIVALVAVTTASGAFPWSIRP